MSPRILPIEQKFFCDRATEKTVTIWVRTVIKIIQFDFIIKYF